MDPIQRALAELRAITPRPATPAEPEPATPSCCTGDRRGYQWHQRTGNLPACPESKAAAKAYMNDYCARTGHKRHISRGKRAA
ncbi:hypothetical protein ACFWIO_34960 [Streptomyces diastatochromogenes]|uniref:hypothetical protein n=1 Tax=Streptomyces diastatochromogenes TaxID=42236 RepID=UPI003657073D